MVREFSAESLVALPRFGVDAGLALWQALQATVAAEKKLPTFVQPAWSGLNSAGIALAQAAQTRFIDSSTKVPFAEKRKADSTVDNATAALDEYLGAWARHADTLAKGQLAAEIRKVLFPDGTRFLKLPYNEEWAQIDRRLALIKSAGLDQKIAQLGGTELVTKLQETHVAYGKALGLTAVPAVPSAPVALRDPLAVFAAALRLYVIKVTAYSDEEKPATVALADRLLRPLVTWTSRAAKGSGDGEPEPSPAAAGG